MGGPADHSEGFGFGPTWRVLSRGTRSEKRILAAAKWGEGGREHGSWEGHQELVAVSQVQWCR